MSVFLLVAAMMVAATVGIGLLRVMLGPGDAERMMAAQLLGSGGVATVLLLAVATRESAMVDVALVLALLAAFASIAFYRGAPDRQSDDPGRGA